MNRLSFSLVVITLCLVPMLASAQVLPSLIPCEGANGVGNHSGAINAQECTFNDLVTLAQNVATSIVIIGLIVSPFIFAYAGYLYIASGGNPGERKKANGIFKNVVIGLFIMLAAWVIVDLVLKALLDPTVYQSVWGSSGGN